MHHDRRFLRTVGVDVERAETFRQVEVDLRGAALPVTADGVAQHIFEFRAVEGASPGLIAVLMRWLWPCASICANTVAITRSA